MFISEFENIHVTISNPQQISMWEKTVNFKITPNVPFFIHWSKLKTKTKYRNNKITVRCNTCNCLVEKTIKHLNSNNNEHFCLSCTKKGTRNGNYGKPMNENFKIAKDRMILEKGNPFTWESLQSKFNTPEIILKRSIASTGKKRTLTTCANIQAGLLLYYKTHRRQPNKTSWHHIKIKYYNDISYQSSYELKFLKHMESISKLHLLERGPVIEYEINSKTHKYYIDYKIKNTNIVIEIKSTYFWEIDVEINLIKKLTAEQLYTYVLIIDNKFSFIDKLLESI